MNIWIILFEIWRISQLDLDYRIWRFSINSRLQKGHWFLLIISLNRHLWQRDSQQQLVLRISFYEAYFSKHILQVKISSTSFAEITLCSNINNVLLSWLLASLYRINCPLVKYTNSDVLIDYIRWAVIYCCWLSLFKSNINSWVKYLTCSFAVTIKTTLFRSYDNRNIVLNWFRFGFILRISIFFPRTDLISSSVNYACVSIFDFICFLFIILFSNINIFLLCYIESRNS